MHPQVFRSYLSTIILQSPCTGHTQVQLDKIEESFIGKNVNQLADGCLDVTQLAF